ncbi:MAG TPA: hypothetical protein GX008_03930 [Firmicutes bacterium]|jgi:hypothetical protein|nr:hypothetical protein [Bacillota bacterium]
MLIPSVVSGVSAGLGGFALRKHWRLSSVQASAIVALVAGLSLPYVHGEGTYLAAVCTCASYAAMSSEETIGRPSQMAIVSGLSGLIMYIAQNCLVGVGGRLGSCAALAVLAFAGWQFAVRVFQSRWGSLRQEHSAK